MVGCFDGFFGRGYSAWGFLKGFVNRSGLLFFLPLLVILLLGFEAKLQFVENHLHETCAWWLVLANGLVGGSFDFSHVQFSTSIFIVNDIHGY